MPHDRNNRHRMPVDQPRPDANREFSVNGLSQDDVEWLRHQRELEEERDAERAERHRRWRDWAQMVAGNTVAAIIAACIIGGPWLWVKRVLHVLFVVTSG